MSDVCMSCNYAEMVAQKYGKTLTPDTCDIHADKWCPELDDDTSEEEA